MRGFVGAEGVGDGQARALEHVGRDGEAFGSWEDTEPSAPQDLPLPPDEPVKGA